MSHFEEPSIDSGDELPSISVVLPVLNEAAFIGETLSKLLGQKYPSDKLEIIVVDGGSTDGTQTVIQSFSQEPLTITLLDNPAGLSSAGRNLGVLKASKDYVLFVDAHVHIPSPMLIADMAKTTVEEGAEVLGRSQPLTAPSLNLLQTSTAAVRASFVAHSRESYIYSDHQGWVSPLSIAVMYKRSLFKKFGLFDETFDAAEDLEFNYRLELSGISAYISPKFTIRYYPRPNLTGLFLQMQRYGLGRARFYKKHPERFRFEAIIPCVTSIGTVLLASLLICTDPLRPMVIGLTLAATLIIIFAAFVSMKKKRLLALFLTPICFLTIHFGLCLGFMKGVLFNRSAPCVEAGDALDEG